MKLLVGNILLFSAYYISAHFTLSLGLPPIGGTPIWVPTGISLAAILIWGYRLLPAVFIGDFIIGTQVVGFSDSTSITIAILFGLQAGGHAWLATWLLRKFKLWPTALISEGAIAKFFAIAAGFSLFLITFLFCLIEWSLGLLPIEQFLPSLFIWWGGSAIGVILFTPLTLILCAQPKKEWRSRLVSVALPLSVLFVLLVFVLHEVRKVDEQNRREIFDENIYQTHDRIEKELQKNSVLLHGMKAFVNNSSYVSQDEFNNYLDEVASFQTNIGDLGWVDYVSTEARPQYEREHHSPILERDEDAVRAAKQRNDYFPLRYFKEGESLTSFIDICAEPTQAMICNEAMNSTGIILIPSLATNNQMLTLVLPIVKGNEFIGFIGQTHDYTSIFGAKKVSVDKQWVALTVTDITDGRDIILYNSKQEEDDEKYKYSTPIPKVKIIEIGGRKWQLDYVPTREFIIKHADWTLYFSITSALLALSLISIYLLSLTGRFRLIESAVETKKNQIKESEEKYRGLVDCIDEEYILYNRDTDGVINYISPSITTILGYKQQEFLDNYAQYLPRNKINSQILAHRNNTLAGNPSHYEIDIVDAQGKLRMLEVSETPMKNEHGELIGIDGVAHDITERKANHLELEKLSLAVKYSPSAVIIINKDREVEYVNPKFSSITGYSFDEAQGGYPHILRPDLSSNDISDDLWKTLSKGLDWRGEVEYKKKNGEFYWAQELIVPVLDEGGRGTISHFVALQNDITDMRRLNDETSYQASHDLLTGLINRHEFELRLSRSIESAKQTGFEHALCFLDLDQFKVVNDTCGHVAGDELLRQVGALMESNIRSRDTLGRLGGDEFSILMEHCGIEQAYQACQNMISTFEGFRFHWEAHTFTIGVSIGLAIIDKHIVNSTEVLKYVDSACYAAKDAGRNRVEIYTEDSARLQQRKGEIQWSNEINDALDSDRFLLYIQPIVPISGDSASLSYEVLLRLQMNDGNIIPPGAFLPAAERYNLSIKIDRWVIRQTLSWLARHSQQIEHIRMFNINLSGQSVGDEAMLGFILKELDHLDVSGDKIKFEITETAAIANLRNASSFMKALSDRGCHFALDDFGSGLSSFAYLKNLRVDTIKIDGMFVKDILTDSLDYEMVKSINDIGHVMGLETVAEFVESEEIMAKLRDIGVDHAQGYSLGKPVPIDTIL